MNMPGHIMIPPGASPRLLTFADKIDQSQVAEIRIVQDWLRSNGQMAPDTGSWRTMW